MGSITSTNHNVMLIACNMFVKNDVCTKPGGVIGYIYQLRGTSRFTIHKHINDIGCIGAKFSYK